MRIESLRRAKLVDEPVIRQIIFELWKLQSTTTTKEDDTKGVDIKAIDAYGRVYTFDVKRNAGIRYNNNAFTFTFQNQFGREYDYDKNVVFIDELYNRIYFVSGDKLREYVDGVEHRVSNTNDSRYVILPLDVLKEISYYTHDLRKFEIDFLARNRDENLFK